MTDLEKLMDAYRDRAREVSIKRTGKVDSAAMIQWLAETCAILSPAISNGYIRAKPSGPPAIPRKPHHKQVDEIKT